jgi:hypothetical protein
MILRVANTPLSGYLGSMVLSNLDAWDQVGYYPFRSTNGFRRSPPYGANVFSVDAGCSPAGNEWTKVELRPDHDFLDWIEETIETNKLSIGGEYLFEAQIKMSTVFNPRVVLEHQITSESVVVNSDQIFQKSDVTYISWTLLSDMSYAARELNLSFNVLKNGAFAATSGYLVTLFKSYDESILPGLGQEVLKRKLIQAQRVADLYVKALYQYNANSDVYEVSTTGSIAKAYRAVDKNFLQSFKKAWWESNLLKFYSAGCKCSDIVVGVKLWRAFSPPLFKVMREISAVATSTRRIQSPVKVNEKTFRGVVGKMVEVVFSGVTFWDQVDIPFIVDIHGKEDKHQQLRFNTALCLLQLGIGSRSRGVIAVNKIIAFDAPVGGIVPGVVDLDPMATLRVSHLTKDCDDEWKAYKLWKRGVEHTPDFTMEDARMRVAVSAHTDHVDRCLQYYLFDPIVHNASNGVVVTADDCYSVGCKRHPREIYMQLLQVCRSYVHSKHPHTIKWEVYKSADRNIFVASKCDRLSKRMKVLQQSIYPGMKAACVSYLNTPGLGLDAYGTHELRRLYICYSFEFFGRGHTKEIAYAQHALQHVSLSSTVYYTTIQFDMFDARTLTDQINEHEQLAVNVLKKERGVNNLKRKALALNEEGEKHTASKRTYSMFRRGDGAVMRISRLTHAGRNNASGVLISRGVEKGREMRGFGVKVSKNALRKVGVNTQIVNDVWNILDGDAK